MSSVVTAKWCEGTLLVEVMIKKCKGCLTYTSASNIKHVFSFPSTFLRTGGREVPANATKSSWLGPDGCDMKGLCGMAI